MLKLILIALCMMISNSGGSHGGRSGRWKWPTFLTFKSPRKFRKQKYEFERGDVVKIVNGPGKGAVGQVGLPYGTDERQNKLPIKLFTDTGEYGKTVRAKPENIMIMNTKYEDLYRLTPREDEVQLWGNKKDLSIDIPPNYYKDCPEWFHELTEAEKLLEKKKFKELLKLLLKSLTLSFFPMPLDRNQFYQNLTKAVASRMEDNYVVQVVEEVHKELTIYVKRIKLSYVQQDKYYNVLKNGLKLFNATVASMLHTIDQKTFDRLLTVAVKTHDEDMCILLVQNGADVNIPGRCDNTPLMGCIQLGMKKCFYALMKSETVNLNQYMCLYKSALHMAAKFDKTGEMCEALLRKGANSHDRGRVRTTCPQVVFATSR